MITEDTKQKLKAKGYKGNFDLESLIDFCTTGQFSLSRLPEAFEGWKAVSHDGDHKGKGETKILAVCNLILDI